MIHSFIQQMLKDVMWGALDYLVFDMPPGTGDAQLSLSQVVPLGGVVMVTTPQDVALLDVRKAIAHVQRLNVPIVGIVENMSYVRVSALQPGHGHLRRRRRAAAGRGVQRAAAGPRYRSTPRRAWAATRARRSPYAVPTRRRPAPSATWRRA